MGVFTKYRYNCMIRLYQVMLEAAFADLKVEIGDKLVTVPIFSSSGERLTGTAIDEDEEVSNVYPRSTFKFSDMQPDNERQSNVFVQRVCTNSDGTHSTSEVPTAKIIQYDYTAITKRRDQALQIIEQVTQVFNPYRVFKMKELASQSTPAEVRVHAEFRPLDDNYSGDVNETLQYQVNFVFTVYGYIYGLNDQTVDVIKEIIIKYNNTGSMEQPFDTLLEWMVIDEDGNVQIVEQESEEEA